MSLPYITPTLVSLPHLNFPVQPRITFMYYVDGYWCACLQYNSANNNPASSIPLVYSSRYGYICYIDVPENFYQLKSTFYDGSRIFYGFLNSSRQSFLMPVSDNSIVISDEYAPISNFLTNNSFLLRSTVGFKDVGDYIVFIAEAYSEVTVLITYQKSSGQIQTSPGGTPLVNTAAPVFSTYRDGVAVALQPKSSEVIIAYIYDLSNPSLYVTLDTYDVTANSYNVGKIDGRGLSFAYTSSEGQTLIAYYVDAGIDIKFNYSEFWLVTGLASPSLTGTVRLGFTNGNSQGNTLLYDMCTNRAVAETLNYENLDQAFVYTYNALNSLCTNNDYNFYIFDIPSFPSCIPYYFNTQRNFAHNMSRGIPVQGGLQGLLPNSNEFIKT